MCLLNIIAIIQRIVLIYVGDTKMELMSIVLTPFRMALEAL